MHLHLTPETLDAGSLELACPLESSTKHLGGCQNSGPFLDP